MGELSAEYWNNRYLNDESGWDLGTVSPPLKAYIDGLNDRDLRILIPGAGNAYEAEYLHGQGFSKVFVLDMAPAAFDNFRRRVPSFPHSHLLEGDFFAHHASYDLILEQTFFCALDPALRKDYVLQMHELLAPGGKLVGLLFDDPLHSDQPPFGGSRQEYEALFLPVFGAGRFEPCYNSVKPRAGRELFISLEKSR